MKFLSVPQVCPSGRYAVGEIVAYPADNERVLGILQRVAGAVRMAPEWESSDGGQFFPVGTWHASSLATLEPGGRLALDLGQGWSLDEADTLFVRDFAAACSEGR